MEEADVQSPLGNAEMEANVMESFMRGFEEVQTIFNQNTVLIHEINRNHEENVDHGGLARNIGLIRELNSNMGQVVQVYANISAAFAESVKELNFSSVDGVKASACAHNQTSLTELAYGTNKESSHSHK